jgi:hypothetical protein
MKNLKLLTVFYLLSRLLPSGEIALTKYYDDQLLCEAWDNGGRVARTLFINQKPDKFKPYVIECKLRPDDEVEIWGKKWTWEMI